MTKYSNKSDISLKNAYIYFKPLFYEKSSLNLNKGCALIESTVLY